MRTAALTAVLALLLRCFTLQAASRAVLPDCCSFPSNGGAPVALTGPVPSSTVTLTAPVDSLLHGGVYDAKNNLLVMTGESGVSIVDPATFALKSLVSIFAAFSVTVHDGVGYTFAGNDAYQFRVDTGKILQQGRIPGDGDYYTDIGGTAFSPDGALLYVSVSYNFINPDLQIKDAKAAKSLPCSVLYAFSTRSMKIVENWTQYACNNSSLILLDKAQSEIYRSVDTLYRCDFPTGVNCISANVDDPFSYGMTNPVLSKDKSTIYVVVLDQLFAINAQTLAVKTQVSVPQLDPGGAASLAIDPEGQYLYITPHISPVVASGPYAIVAVSDLQAVGTIPTTYTYYSPSTVIFVPF